MGEFQVVPWFELKLTLTGSNIRSLAGLPSGLGFVYKTFTYTLHRGFPSDPAHLLTSLSLDCSSIPDRLCRSFISVFATSRIGRVVSITLIGSRLRHGIATLSVNRLECHIPKVASDAEHSREWTRAQAARRIDWRVRSDFLAISCSSCNEGTTPRKRQLIRVFWEGDVWPKKLGCQPGGKISHQYLS